MKKISKLLVVVLLFGFLTGCKLKEEIGFKIDANKKISFKLLYAMDNEMIDAMINSGTSSEEDGEIDYTEEMEATIGATQDEVEETLDDEKPTITDEMRWKFLEDSVKEDYNDGFKYEKYEKDSYKGYIVTKELGNIDDFVATTEERVAINDDFNGKKLFIKTNNGYKSLMKFDKGSENLDNASQYEQMGVLFDVKFIINLPNKSISNNATSVSEDGLTLTWNLLKLTSENIDFEFNFNDKTKTSSNLMVYLGIGGLALLLIIVVVIILSRKKNKNVNVNTYENTASNNQFLNAVQNNGNVMNNEQPKATTQEFNQTMTNANNESENIVHTEPFDDSKNENN